MVKRRRREAERGGREEKWRKGEKEGERGKRGEEGGERAKKEEKGGETGRRKEKWRGVGLRGRKGEKGGESVVRRVYVFFVRRSLKTRLRKSVGR